MRDKTLLLLVLAISPPVSFFQLLLPCRCAGPSRGITPHFPFPIYSLIFRRAFFPRTVLPQFVPQYAVKHPYYTSSPPQSSLYQITAFTLSAKFSNTPSYPDATNLRRSKYSPKDFSHKGGNHFAALWADVCVLLAHSSVGRRSNPAVSADVSCGTGQALFDALTLQRTSSDSRPQLWRYTLTPLQLGSSRPQPHYDVYVVFLKHYF